MRKALYLADGNGLGTNVSFTPGAAPQSGARGANVASAYDEQ
jgi:hypothetical protein